MTRIPILAASGALLCALLASACDRPPTAATPLAPEPGPAVALTRLVCTVAVDTGALGCAAPAARTGGARPLIVGGPNGTYVQLEASGHTYSAVDSLFSIDVSVQNLLFQALGTTDGDAADAAGVRIAFLDEPVATAMTSPGAPLEEVVLANEQRGMILHGDQAYFQYAGALQPNATSESVQWQFRMSSGVERFAFSVVVSAAVPFPDGTVLLAPAADTVAAGGTVSLTASVVNAVGEPLADQAVAFSSASPGVATVAASGTVTGVSAGTATITATQGALSGSATVAVCPAIDVGAVFVADMPAGSSLCLPGGEYVLIPTNVSTAASVSLNVTGAGIVPVSGAPSPALLPGGAALRGASPRLARDHAWETRLRRRERATLPGFITRGASGGARRAITPGVPAVGALMSLNVETDFSCSNPDNRTGRVVAVGTHIVILADTMNPSGGLTAADYQAVADSFDTVIHPTLTGVFGTPGDIDGNGRVIAFYTRAVNELTPPGSSSYVGGFVFARDLLPVANCSTSNVGEMFYMLAADPAGLVNGNVRDVALIKSSTLGTLAHEFEHLINASRRMWINTPWNGAFEEAWLDEGLAHVSEELMFHARSGLTHGTNIGVADIADGGVKQASFFRYQGSNFSRLRQWLLSPHANGAFDSGDDLATRGAAWAFLRYASDRSPGTDAAFWSALLNTGNTGLANLQAVVGADPLPWYRDFVAAMYGDDAGIGSVAPFTQPSWNFRSLYNAIDYTGDGAAEGYQLAPRNPANGVAETVTLAAGGGAAYLRMGVPGGGFAGVTVQSGGAAPASTVRMSVLRRK